jgi:electron transport complex protein RnfD
VSPPDSSDGVGRLHLATAPFTQSGLSTRRLMGEVLLGTVPVLAVAAWTFGAAALLVTASAVLGACGSEWAVATRARRLGSLRDGSALLTGVLLALTLPPAVPLWMAFLGGASAILLGKAIWGGLGGNLFNPALVGRAFLQAAFPTALTTWTEPGRGFFQLPVTTLAPPLLHGDIDAVTTATPLSLAKFDGVVTSAGPLFTGHVAGSLGETSALVLIAVGLVLGLRRVFDWRLPVATLLSVAVFGAALHVALPESAPPATFLLLSGGLLFGAVFMVTDPVTTPITPRGAWIFGAGVGLLVVLIRLYGGLAEGVMYAILLMNAVTPLVNAWTQPRLFGGGRS